jgi:hypothetical protein
LGENLRDGLSNVRAARKPAAMQRPWKASLFIAGLKR